MQRFTYLPYGQSQVLTSGWTSTSDAYDWSYRFQGGRLEAGTGKVYFRNRDYDVTAGTWEEEDPMGAAGSGSNLSEADASSPATYVDPSGTLVIFVHGIGPSQHRDKAPYINAGLQEYWKENGGLEQAFVQFLWGPATVFDAAAGHEKEKEATNDKINEAAKALQELVQRLKAEKDKAKCPEPIFIYAYSLGAAVVKKALESGMDVDGVVIGGGTGVHPDEDWQKAAEHVGSNGLLNLWSPADGVNRNAFTNDIGGYGIDMGKKNPNKIKDVKVENVDHYRDMKSAAARTPKDENTEWDSFYMAKTYFAKEFLIIKDGGVNCLSHKINEILDPKGKTPSPDGYYQYKYQDRK